ncbi:MAG: peptide chain release factor N(5)-glutamine methyltransferase [Algisphaera sp.]
MPDAPWTTRRLLQWTTQHFEERHVDSPRVCAEMLLSHVLKVERLRLYMEPDRPASDAERTQYRDLVTRAGQHEPVDYLVGRAPFFGLELEVNPAVLIPRPSTETLVEFVLQDARHREGNPIALADVCTGSGAVAVALAKHLPAASVVATDLSEPALEVARRNIIEHGVADQIDVRRGDLYAPLAEARFDYLLSNPPYIRDAEWADVAPNVKDHEPTTALRSGTDGLDHLRPLIAAAADHLNPGGHALFEHAASHEDDVLALATAAGFSNAHVLRDHERLPRVLVLTAPE